MAVFLAVFIQCTGVFILMQFTAPVFVESGSSIEPNDAAIVVAVLQILGTYISVLLIDRTGRKILLLFSCFGASLALFTFGTYTYFDRNGIQVNHHNWIPVVSLSLAIFILSIGVNTVPFVLLTEIFPPEIKGVGLTVANLSIAGSRFVLMKVFISFLN